jgi:hypothetical protein
MIGSFSYAKDRYVLNFLCWETELEFGWQFELTFSGVEKRNEQVVVK